MLCLFANLAALGAEAISPSAMTEDQLVEALRESPAAEVITYAGAAERAKFVAPLLSLVENKEASAQSREQALQAVERITHAAFRKLPSGSPSQAHAIEQPAPLESESADLGVIAARYRDWFAAEGSDSKKWLSAAVQKAKRLLDGPRLDDVKRGAMFLGFDCGRRDPDAQRTIDRLTQIATRLRNPTIELQREWVSLIAAYGPQARLASDTLIAFARKSGQAQDVRLLRAVGGREIMEYLITALPKWAEQSRTNTDAAAIPVEARRAFDRWSGRTFKNDDERYTWWKANAPHTPRQWLEDSLITLAQQTDGNLPAAMEIAKEVLPQMVSSARAEFREKWLKQNRAKLEYDANRGTFRLKTE